MAVSLEISLVPNPRGTRSSSSASGDLVRARRPPAERALGRSLRSLLMSSGVCALDAEGVTNGVAPAGRPRSELP